MPPGIYQVELTINLQEARNRLAAAAPNSPEAAKAQERIQWYQDLINGKAKPLQPCQLAGFIK